ncbi:MAG TPA: hypothetical protein VJ207_07670 [Thermoplasmata archaeon]|nr:hypothetical protein [Thermoplasmata archaeon]
MAGTVSKGNRLQVMARKLLEADGYTVHTAVRSVQKRGPIWISQTTDIFNAFDLIATRIDPPRPLRFIQVTTKNSVSERVKKVDPVPINPGVATSEIWAYVGGQKRLDRRYKDRKVWLSRNYFQVYYKERNWELDPTDRIAAAEETPKAARPAQEAARATVMAIVRSRRTKKRAQPAL